VKKRLLYVLATLAVLLSSVNVIATVMDDPGGSPTCNPLTDPRCK
jgi:hypothetical protein